MQAGGIAEHSAKFRTTDLRDKRPDLLVCAVGIATMKNDAGIGIGGMKMDGNRLAAMDAYT
jgi:hypothetical protein